MSQFLHYQLLKIPSFLCWLEAAPLSYIKFLCVCVCVCVCSIPLACLFSQQYNFVCVCVCLLLWLYPVLYYLVWKILSIVFKIDLDVLFFYIHINVSLSSSKIGFLIMIMIALKLWVDLERNTDPRKLLSHPSRSMACRPGPSGRLRCSSSNLVFSIEDLEILG